MSPLMPAVCTCAFPGRSEMNENLLDVLMYLFENYFEDEVVLGPDQETVKLELSQAGFPDTVINRAFNWLEGLAHSDQHAVPNSHWHIHKDFIPSLKYRLMIRCPSGSKASRSDLF